MNIETKFNIGQKVRRVGTRDWGEVYEIDINVREDGEVTTVYEVHHARENNPHVGADFGGHGYESEFEAIGDDEIVRWDYR